MSIISPAFKDRIAAIHGHTGQKWLESLTDLQEKLARRWSLSDIRPITNLSYNYLVFATRSDQKQVVLKIGVPHQELESEILALQAFDGKGSVRLLEADPTLGALLLERILPGDNLLSIPDDQKSTRIAAGVMKKIWTPASPQIGFPTTADWCRGFQRYLEKYSDHGPLPVDLVLRASKLANQLLETSQDLLLLHGDLHHMNILLGENGRWIAIDPKGIVGEAAFEVGALLLNPVPALIDWPNLMDVQKKRLLILEESLSMDWKRLAAWSFARAVLSAVWSLEDGEDWQYGIKIAGVLNLLIKNIPPGSF